MRVGIIEFEKDVEPNWHQAENLLYKAIKVLDYKNVCQEVLPEEDWDIDKGQKRLLQALTNTWKAYVEGNIHLFKLRNSQVLIATNEKLCDDFALLELSGIARALGAL